MTVETPMTLLKGNLASILRYPKLRSICSFRRFCARTMDLYLPSSTCGHVCTQASSITRLGSFGSEPWFGLGQLLLFFNERFVLNNSDPNTTAAAVSSKPPARIHGSAAASSDAT